MHAWYEHAYYRLLYSYTYHFYTLDQRNLPGYISLWSRIHPIHAYDHRDMLRQFKVVIVFELKGFSLIQPLPYRLTH